LAALVAGAAVIIGDTSDARACGACFVNASESTVVSDHRMALALSTTETVLWDQITYQGNPSEFAYVVPVRAGTRVETSNDAWFAALDASTRPIIMGPRPQYGGGGGGGGGYYGGGAAMGDGEGGRGGCACGADSFASAPAADNGAASEDASAAGQGAAPPDPVRVIDQEVVGSYETVTLRSDDPNALYDWLLTNGFDVPDTARPIIGDYLKEGLDFLAMRLRPSANVRAMEPIRIVTPGADPTLPLRMMRIGAGPKLGITLFVLGEGRYHPKNFPDAKLDASKLIWDPTKVRSNYQTLSLDAMAQEGGRSWLTEYAKRWSVVLAGSGGGGMLGNPSLPTAYESACPASLPYVPTDAGPPFLHEAGHADTGAQDAPSDAPSDSAPIDAAADAAPADASADSGHDAGPPHVRTHRCDDLDLALTGLHPDDVWLVRVRALLPNEAMDTPLELEPAPAQVEVENVYQTTELGTVSAGLRLPDDRRGTYATIAAAMLAVWSLLRRRSSPSRRLQ
jgi:hypothetical protein